MEVRNTTTELETLRASAAEAVDHHGQAERKLERSATSAIKTLLGKVTPGTRTRVWSRLLEEQGRRVL